MFKICSTCKIEKELNEENFAIRSKKNDIIIFRGQCVDCRKKFLKENRKSYALSKQGSIIIDRTNQRYENSKNGKETRKLYEHSDKRKSSRNRRLKEKKNNDNSFKLRCYVSVAIYQQLKNNSATKNSSCFDYLLYSVNDLCTHLESKFEPWMSWNNYGKNKNILFNENDSFTWTWELDHIIPQALLPYNTMSDINFLICWDLENLRPLRSDLNKIKNKKLIFEAIILWSKLQSKYNLFINNKVA